MPYAFDGSHVPQTLEALPCGGIPEFDDGSGYAYRCNNCGAVVGSIAMPKECADALNARQVAQSSGGASAVQVFKTVAQAAKPHFDVLF